MRRVMSALDLVNFHSALQVAVIAVVGDRPQAALARFGALASRIPCGLSPAELTLLKAILAMAIIRWAADIVQLRPLVVREIWAMFGADDRTLPDAYRRVLDAIQRDLSADEDAAPIPDDRVVGALAYIKENCTRQTLRVADVARAVHLSPWYLQHLLKEHTGVRFTRHVLHARQNAAGQLLLNSNLSVKEVAARIGYAHVSTFTRDFKAMFNIAPRDWRRTQAERFGQHIQSKRSHEGACNSPTVDGHQA